MNRRRDVQLEILRRLLETTGHASVRQISRDLGIPSGHVFYHLKRMVKTGVLIKRTWTDEVGDVVSQFVEYEPQPIFYDENALNTGIVGLIGKIDDPTPEKIGACILFILKLSKLS